MSASARGVQARPAPRSRQRTAPGTAVILAGGKGTRLAPYTSILPKPLMPIGDKAILEIIIDQLAAQRFREITLCVGYLAHLIRSVLDHRVNGKVSIQYVYENKALGTAGPLRAIGDVDRPFVVMNGDVLTTLDYGQLLEVHRETGNALTIATTARTSKMNYGVLHLDGSIHPTVRRVVAYEEKPVAVSMVSMGVYVLEPRVVDYIPTDSYFDFPDLVQALLAGGEQVGSYVYDGTWFDIGRHDDYELAAQQWAESPNGRNGRSHQPGSSLAPSPNGASGRAHS
jgi:NDP-sugar pyrophosphorylase family protein